MTVLVLVLVYLVVAGVVADLDRRMGRDPHLAWFVGLVWPIGLVDLTFGGMSDLEELLDEVDRVTKG